MLTRVDAAILDARVPHRYRLLADLARLAVRSGRSKDLEIIVLRHQLQVLRPQVDRPAVTDDDRTLLGAIAAALRSCSGWAAGSSARSIVLAFTDGVPITGPLVVVLSVAVPIWLGLYLAWVKRRWATETKITGLAVAAGGTLLGAWLGFGAGGWLFSIITSMLGAAVFGNLALIVLDLAWDRQRRRRILGADSGAIPVPSPADPRTRVDVSLRGHSG